MGGMDHRLDHQQQDRLMSDDYFKELHRRGWRVCVCVCVSAHVCSSCLTLSNSTDCSPPGSSFHGISQARLLEWVVISFSRESSWPGDWTRASCLSCISRQILYHWANWSVQNEFLLSSKALGQAEFSLSFSWTLIYLESPKGNPSCIMHPASLKKQEYQAALEAVSTPLYFHLLTLSSLCPLQGPNEGYEAWLQDWEKSPLRWKREIRSHLCALLCLLSSRNHRHTHSWSTGMNKIANPKPWNNYWSVVCMLSCFGHVWLFGPYRL